jgi:hypothetical protein
MGAVPALAGTTASTCKLGRQAGEALPEGVPLSVWQSHRREHKMLKVLGGTVGIIFLIGLLVVIGIFALIF